MIILAEEKQALPSVAYFCKEYGLHNELPIYAGGLGVLAGDYLKAAKDLNKPVTAIGILWRNDYTKQLIGENGRPYDIYPYFDYEYLEDIDVTVNLEIMSKTVECKVKLANQYGNVPLYLLDTGYTGSEQSWITDKLYGGNEKDRVAAEMVLGIGGIRLLRALEIHVDQYHLNEGHAVFAGIELIRERMENGLSFEKAWEETKAQVILTTHTPVRAGNEEHNHGHLQYMGAYNGLTYEQIDKIGGDPFNMTVAGLRLSHIANGVSKIHGQTARKMWAHVDNTAPILSITNGVHRSTWQDPEIKSSFESGGDLWNAHINSKKRLISFIEQRTGSKMDPEVLTIGFARRVAPYKRGELIFRDPRKLDPMIQ